MRTSHRTIISVTVHQMGTARVLAIAGEIDEATAPAIHAHTGTIFDRQPSSVVVDFRDVTFCAAVGIQVIDELRRGAVAAGIPFSLVAREGPALRVLRFAGMPDLRIHAALDDAL